MKIYIKLALAIALFTSATLHAHGAAADNTTTSRLATREAELETRYLALFNTYDPTYLASDAACKTFRDQEIKVERKKRIDSLAQKIEMEDRIVNLCHRTAWDRFSDNTGHLIDAGKNAILLEDFTGITERATRWALSKNTYDILVYENLDKILSEKCFPGKPHMNLYFKRALARDDVSPALVGTAGWLIAGWYILKGAGKLIFSPAKNAMVARGATPVTFKKIKAAGYLVGAPLLGLSIFYTVKENKDASEVVEVEQETEKMVSRISLEATFPEPEVDLAASECLSAASSVQEAPTDDLRNFWRRSAQAKCDIFKSRAEYALSSLQNDDYNRCHPGNRGAAERIQAQMLEISELAL